MRGLGRIGARPSPGRIHISEMLFRHFGNIRRIKSHHQPAVCGKLYPINMQGGIVMLGKIVIVAVIVVVVVAVAVIIKKKKG